MIFYQDFLQYRIPGEDPVLKEGAFQLLKKGETPSGFVVSNFKGEEVYQWVPRGDGSWAIYPEPEETSRSQYEKSAKAFVKHLKKHGGKAVLSRVKKVEAPEVLERQEYFDALCEAYPNAFVYMFLSGLIGFWVGATPETLIASEKGKARTMALAGTRRSGDDLPWAEKEFEEHELVADFIQSNLEEMGMDSLQRFERKEQISGPVRHLLTDFQFNLPKGKEWEMARKLHPTPAVSGWPVEDSMELIAENEAHDRRFYAGIIGLIEEKTLLYVNLRCAEYAGDSMYLYVGGGFTKDSDIESEWNETENKAATLINVLKNG